MKELAGCWVFDVSPRPLLLPGLDILAKYLAITVMLSLDELVLVEPPTKTDWDRSFDLRWARAAALAFESATRRRTQRPRSAQSFCLNAP
jgi:hypothetical protein